jgi:phosphatidylserine decarboxylase
MRMGALLRAWTPRIFTAVVSVVAVDVAVACIRAAVVPRVRIVERGTGRVVDERRPLGEHARIVLAWTTVSGSRVLCRTPAFLRYLERSSVSHGEAMDRPDSAGRIARFIADYDVDLADLDRPPDEFATLNDFFARPLRPGARAIACRGEPAVAVCPVDGRVTCMDTDGRAAEVHVKGWRHEVAGLLGVDVGRGAEIEHAGRSAVRAFLDAARADGFSIAICRLAPGDYHRIHWPVDGSWRRGDVLDLRGEYHSVAPTCVHGPVDVLGRNRRVVVTVRSGAFGEVAIVAVGAVKVGSVEVTATPGAISKGDEMGVFRYGGSTVVLVFRRGTVQFDDELVANSARGMETLVRMGSPLGRATRSAGTG